MSTSEAIRAKADDTLRRLAGPEARLRPDQWRAIEALVVERRRALVVQRTGWGKSAVYFIATALLRGEGSGPTVIISPLLALMRNQLDAAARAGIHGRTINSANVEEWQDIQREVLAGAVDVLLVSPERLNNPDFRDTMLPRLAETAGLLVVDEAHCISDWGHDFRPDYRRLRTLLATLRPGVPVLATTATANARVTADIADQLGTSAPGATAPGLPAPGAPASGPPAPGAPAAEAVASEALTSSVDGAGSPALVIRGSLDRESLALGVLRLPSPAHRLAWLADHLGELPGSGIVYTLTVSAAEDIATFLRSCGHAVASYSGRTEDQERRDAESALLANRLKALVATSALGMGFDKPDLGFVLHLGAPQSPIAYYQQVGRAGRALPRADVLLLPGAEDEAIWRYFASLAFPAEEQVWRALDALAASERPLSTAALEARVDLRRSRLEMMLKVLDVDGVVRRVRGGWVATGEKWAYDAERYAGLAAARAAEQQAMREYVTTTGCRLEFLRRQLDDPRAEPCGRCDACAGPRYSTQVSGEALAAAERHLGRPGVELEPRKQWPSAMPALGVALSGRIPAGELAATGRALGRLSDIGWGNRLRDLFAAGSGDTTVPDDVFGAVVSVLANWGWESRPAAVVTVPSRSRPRLVDDLAARLASTGRLPLLGPLAVRGEPARARSNSAQRLRAVHDAFTVPPALASAIADLGSAPLLLVDDRYDTGWTMTVAARLLRQAGAGAVLPFVLAAEG